MSINVTFSPWTVRAPGTHITRQYEFKNLAGEGTETLFQVWVSAHNSSGVYYEFVRFFLAPTLIPQECFLVAFLGTMDEQVEAGFFTVKTTLVNGGGNTFRVQAESESDNAHKKCLAVLDAGKPMRFLLHDKQQCLIKMPLENDLSYRSALAEMRGIATGTRSARPPQGRHDASVPAMLDSITSTIVQLKQRTAMSYAVILPSMLAVSSRLLVQHRGLEAALEALGVVLEITERGSPVPSSAIMRVEHPEQPLSHRNEADSVFWSLAQELHAMGHRINDIAQTFESVALQLAEEKVDKLYAIAILKQAHDNLKREAL